MNTIKAENFVAGRIYSVVYNSEVEMTRKKRDTGAVNPLADESVTVRRVSSVQAAGPKTWTNYLAKRGESPVGSRPPFWKVTDYNPCIVQGITENTMGREYLRGLPRGVTKEAYFVNGVEATPAQIEVIRLFKKGGSNDNPAEFVLLALAKLENVDSGEGEAE
jgi:hypothetical protein